ncbi:hypothetical protein [Streptomyces sp. NPDC088246]|uniref:hypothetical protein n=1 Tax=Streptomyces sp. NPDC088246 TaxID=3365842 RepID=UPI0038087D53
MITSGVSTPCSLLLSKGPEAAADLDFNFLQLEPRGGKNVEDVVGGAELMINAGYNHDHTRLIGYPANQKRPLDCTDKTVRYDSTDPKIPGSFLRIACDKYSGGASGGPFLIKRGSDWAVIGVIDGWKTGGDKDDISYSSCLDSDAKALYGDAVNNRQPAGRGVLGKVETWQHADVMTGGYFTDGNPGSWDYSDLIVRWAVSTARSRSRSPTGSGRTPPSWAPATTRTTATRTTSWCGGPTARCPCTRMPTRPA